MSDPATATTVPGQRDLRYRRILLKLSGEALLGDRPYGVDPTFCAFIAQQVASLNQALVLAQAYARFGDDFDLKEYAARSAPKIEARLEQVRQIETRYARRGEWRVESSE